MPYLSVALSSFHRILNYHSPLLPTHSYLLTISYLQPQRNSLYLDTHKLDTVHAIIQGKNFTGGGSA